MDTLKIKDTTHSPKKATILSAVLPGAGQIYNKKWWKTPILYGGLGVAGYYFSVNNREFKHFKKQYIDTESEYALNKLETFRTSRDYAALAFIAVYALQIIDANVDAHLFYFDVSDDLSLQWSPKQLYDPRSITRTSLGLSVQINF